MEVPETLEKLLSEATVSADVLENIRNQFEVLLARIDRGLRGGPAPAPRLGAGAAAARTAPPPQPAQDPLSGIVGTVGRFTGALTAGIAALVAFIALPPLLATAVTHFVGALNPGLVEYFNQLLSNLTATIGFGLEPIVAQAADVIKQWTGMLMPLMRELRPVISELAEVVAAVMIPVLMNLALMLRVTVAAFRPLLMIVGAVAKLFGNVAEVFETLMTAVFNMVADFAALTGALDVLADALHWFRTVIGHAATGLVFLAAATLRLAGMMNSLTKFREALEKRLNERRGATEGMVAAPKDVGTSGIEDIARRMSERAFAAQRGAVARSDTELLEEILGAVQTAERLDLRAIIRDGVRDGFKAAKESVVGGSTGRSAVASSITDESSSPTSSGPGVLGRLANSVNLGIAGGMAAIEELF